MNCCINCFKDIEIIGFILSNSNETGTCDYCKSKDVKLLDPRELEEMFLPVISIYTRISALGLEVQEDDQKKLYERLQLDWNIFNPTHLRSVRWRNKLLKDILTGSYIDDDPIFSEAVVIAAHYIDGFDTEFHERKWENFANEIKSTNRFFLKETIDLALLARLLRVFEKTYRKGKIFYRARISSKEGHPVMAMGKPPAEKSTPGRANPSGIPYLYVSAAQKTTEYESRSSYLDYVTVGTFKLIDDLSVVSLRNTHEISPFVLEDSVENYVVHQKYLARLEKELSKPVRRFDKELDYLPTEYLCEYVKSLGYDAIEYGSALHKGGINLAIFNDTKIECRSVQIYEVDSMELHLEPLSAL